MGEKMRKEVADAKQHITGLTRQLQELQMRCDGLGQERDALRRALQDAQDSSGSATSNLSRELERLHHDRNELAAQLQKLAGEKEDLQQEMARRDQEYVRRAGWRVMTGGARATFVFPENATVPGNAAISRPSGREQGGG